MNITKPDVLFQIEYILLHAAQIRYIYIGLSFSSGQCESITWRLRRRGFASDTCHFAEQGNMIDMNSLPSAAGVAYMRNEKLPEFFGKHTS